MKGTGTSALLRITFHQMKILFLNAAFLPLYKMFFFYFSQANISREEIVAETPWAIQARWQKWSSRAQFLTSRTSYLRHWPHTARAGREEQGLGDQHLG